MGHQLLVPRPLLHCPPRAHGQIREFNTLGLYVYDIRIQRSTTNVDDEYHWVNRVVGPTLGFEDKFCMAPLVTIIVLASQRHLLSLPLYVFIVVQQTDSSVQ